MYTTLDKDSYIFDGQGEFLYLNTG